MNGWLGKNSRAVAFLRVSSYRQQDNTSHEIQLKEIEEHCVFHGLTLVRIEKLVESAKDSDDRKKFSEAQSRALQEQIRHHLYYMFDRETRNLTDNEANEKLVREDKIVLHYVRDRKILHKYSPDSDFFLRDIQAVSNKQFIRNLSAKVGDAMLAKAEEGWYPGNWPPLGYVHQRRRDENGRELKRGTIIVPDPNLNRQRQVQREFELRAQRLSYGEIRKQIIGEGLLVQTKYGRYYEATIEQRLKSPFYRGRFRWQGKEYLGKHQLIIPQNILEAVDATFWNRGLKRRDDGIFAGGWLKCGHPDCGCNIVFDPKKKEIKGTGEIRHFRYYRCTNGKRVHKNLKGLSIVEDKIWEQFEESAVGKISITEQFADSIANAMNELQRKVRFAMVRQADSYKDALRALEQREDRIYDDYTQSVLDEDGYRRQLRRIREERSHFTNLLTEADQTIADAGMETAKSILELATNAKLLWKRLQPIERRNLLERVLSNQVLDGLTVRFDLKKPFLWLVENHEMSEWRTREDSNLRPSAPEADALSN